MKTSPEVWNSPEGEELRLRFFRLIETLSADEDMTEALAAISAFIVHGTPEEVSERVELFAWITASYANYLAKGFMAAYPKVSVPEMLRNWNLELREKDVLRRLSGEGNS